MGRADGAHLRPGRREVTSGLFEGRYWHFYHLAPTSRNQSAFKNDSS